jgi:flavin-dependent thymidylate synthase
MKVILAGYNIDAEMIREAVAAGIDKNKLTPETLSAAYARISRSPKSVTELRRNALDEVAKARESNERIIFGLGHHSVAEHAVFNFDVMGISRRAIEALEHFRLNAYTEKSQRYITLKGDFVLPEEIIAAGETDAFHEMIRMQNGLYEILYEKLLAYTFNKHPELASDPKNKSLLQGWAKEDARYITALATEGQLGLTLNARNLEFLIRRFASHPLAEVRMLGVKLYELAKEVAPSIILFTTGTDYDANTYPALQSAAAKRMSGVPSEKGPFQTVRLIDFTPNADEKVIASLFHTVAGLSWEDCRRRVNALTVEDKRDFLKEAFQRAEFYDFMLRELEHAQLTYELIVSASCFAQLKRHRMTTITCQEYRPDLGLTIPHAIEEIGLEKDFREVIGRTEVLYERLSQKAPHAAPYVLTNAHRRRVLLTTNIRELYHISRLRQDEHAQWDIRDTVDAMVLQAKEVMPLSLMTIGGKDKYRDIFQACFNRLPRVVDSECTT